jgi:hypothetical protein
MISLICRLLEIVLEFCEKYEGIYVGIYICKKRIFN